MSERGDSSGGRAPERYSATWQACAGSYRESWEPVTGLFASALLDALDAAPGDLVLDLACGTGIVAESAVDRGARPIGMDAASAMVFLSAQRVTGARFVVGDAVRPPLAPSRLDGAAINFGLHHFADAAEALGALRRSLRPGGRLAYTSWAAPDENPALRELNAVYERYLGDVRDTTREAEFPFGDRHRYRAALEEIGFDPGSVDLSAVTRHWRPPSEESVFLAELRGGGSKTERLRRLSDERLATIRDAICEVVARFRVSHDIELPVTAYVVVARVGGSAR